MARWFKGQSGTAPGSSCAVSLPAGLMPLSLTVLVSCAGLTSLNPDLAQPSRTGLLHTARPPPLQLAGAKGVLSHAQSQAILQRQARSGPATGIFERHLALAAEFTGSPLTAGNRVHLLQDGPATYQAMFAAIADARDQINLETYFKEGTRSVSALPQRWSASSCKACR